MNVRCAVVVVILSTGMLAQSAPCPADRPVDDIIAEIHKQQSKKSSRTKNPLPESVCIFGWCRGGGAKTPPTVPEPEPRVETRGDGSTNSGKESSSKDQTTAGNESSSRNPSTNAACDVAMDQTLDAAHNVEVGDYYFAEKNYRAALLRYTDALQGKPGDAAIHVRLGRVFEKQKQLSQAIEQYEAAQKLAGPGKWADEARSALARLQRGPRS